MITRHVSLDIKVQIALSSLALFALAAWSSSALAATAVETRCDQSVRSVDMPDDRSPDLNIEIVDHGPARSSGTIEEDSSQVEATARPKVEVLLRRIFDEPQLRPVDASESEKVEEMAAPLAVDQVETVEEAAKKANSDDAGKTSADLPGVSADDLLRFKRQMYRTDI